MYIKATGFRQSPWLYILPLAVLIALEKVAYYFVYNALAGKVVL